MTTKRPPVFFTVAALRHEPLLAIGEFFPKIQDDLRRQGYSGPVDVDTLAVQPEGRTAQVFHSYTVFTPERTAAFTFNEQGVFSYHTSAYTTREDLFSAFRLGLEILHRHLDLKLELRVGVRMLDLIRPSDSQHTLADFVKPQLLGFSGLGCSGTWKTGLATLEQHFFDGEAEVTARLACLPDGFGLDAELFPTVKGHALPPHLTSVTGVLHGILDIDSGTRMSETSAGKPFDMEEVMAKLTNHKDRIRNVFRDAVSETALKAWGLSS
jgi:uncharacterized protein (TIGR04255 family)